MKDQEPVLKSKKPVAVLKVFDRTRKYQLGRSQEQLKKWLRGFTEWREAGHVGSNQNGWKPRQSQDDVISFCRNHVETVKKEMGQRMNTNGQ